MLVTGRGGEALRVVYVRSSLGVPRPIFRHTIYIFFKRTMVRIIKI